MATFPPDGDDADELDELRGKLQSLEQKMNVMQHNDEDDTKGLVGQASRKRRGNVTQSSHPHAQNIVYVTVSISCILLLIFGGVIGTSWAIRGGEAASNKSDAANNNNNGNK